MYSEHGAMNFVDVYGVGEGRESEEAAKPFIQTVQLVGESGELVDVVATFDDCAMVNCIDTKVFEGARATLSSPDVSLRVLRMANGVLVPSGGCWRGKISVGGVSATGKWEIFSGGGAWQMLLGKPMLKAFGASHEYMDDTVTLNTVAGKVTLRNELDPSAEGSRQKEVAVAHVSDPGECLGTSPLKPGQVNDFILHIPVDQVLGSQESVATVELQTEAGTLGSVEDGSRNPKVAVAHASDPGACDACLPPPSGQVPSPDIPVSVDAEPLQRPSYSARKRARLAARKKRETERALARETVLVVWAAMEKCFVNHGTSSFRRLVRRVKSKAERTRRVLLRRWYNTPWDTATVPAVVVESGDTGGEDEILVGVPSKTSDGKVLVQEVEDSGDIPDVEGLRKQSRDAHASNPGECCGASPLRRKGVDCFHSAACAHRLTEEADWWLSVAELEGDENAGADGLQKQSRNVSASDLGERESISPLRPGSQGADNIEDRAIASAEGVRKIKVADAHASNPGGSVNSLPLKHRQVLNPEKQPSVDEHAEILAVFGENDLDASAPGTEQPEIGVDDDSSVFTRHLDPFNPARVARILEVVEIGDDITVDERAQVEAVIREYADVYALSVSEVKAIPGAVHRLHVPVDAKLNTRIQQRQLTPPQTAYFSKALDTMIDAGIIEPIAAADVKCVSPITLAAKAHSAQGLTIEELHARINAECARAQLPEPFDAPAVPGLQRDADTSTPQKWRVCTNYKSLNDVTQVLQMPQGDIRTKQQALSGHRWVSLFDFASGFYAVEVAVESRPYTAFGAPSCFNEVTAKALQGLVGTMLQLFVDDGAMAGDIFVDKLHDLRTFLQRCREQTLSISPQKTKLFMTEVTAVVNWAVPETIQNLQAFLGLTGYFRPLVKNYSLLEKPLKDLVNTLQVPPHAGRQAYRNAARRHEISAQWTAEHQRTFLTLKVALTSAPVVKPPKYDGSSFIVTTDGCKDGFAGVLSQRFDWIDARGNKQVRVHPLGFVSKRTSDTESRYQPYLLEFAALKYTLDKFSDTIGGHPVELETDCQALKDTIMNNKLNSTHARWLDGIMNHHIVNCRHRPGKNNQAADGLSRQFTDTPRVKGDGHEWSVDPDWASSVGLAYDIWSTQLSPEQTALRERFANEPVFLEVVEAMYNLDHGKRVRDKRRARHRMLGYEITDGKLWRIGDGKSTRARARLECITQAEAKAQAAAEHAGGGHFGRDLIKIKMLDRVCSPRLDKSIVSAIVECGQCKAFGGAHLAALLEPITRRHPWELMVGDYLSMPVGKGGFKTIGLYMDVYSQKTWAFKFTGPGTMATTNQSLERIRIHFRMPEVFMADGGSHFAGTLVAEYCESHGSRYQQVAAYSPWVNGLLEGQNGKLLSRLKRMCAPHLGEDGWSKITKFTDLPANWPDHLDEAIRQLNDRILPAYKFAPNELCLGLVVNTNDTPLEISTSELTENQVGLQNTYLEQQTLDAYSHIVEHAMKRKAAFDKRVMDSRDGVIEYRKGDLVQIRDSSLDLTLSTDSKIRLETIHGLPVRGAVSARRLRHFNPRRGTELFAEQTKIEMERAGGPDEAMEGVDVEEGDGDEGDVEDVVLGEGEVAEELSSSS